MAKNPYNPAACCGTHCYRFDPKHPENCWGDVEVTGGDEAIYDDDGEIIDTTPFQHSCEAHDPDRAKGN